MEYYGNTLCISVRELVDGGIMSIPNYKQLAARGRIDVVRRGGGSSNNYALVAVSSLPDTYKDKVKALYPDPSLEVLLAWLDANYEIDQAAVAYFADWRNKCGHDHATDAHVAEYVANASVLNACIRLYNNAKAIHKTMGLKYDWSMMSQAVEGYRMKTNHTLPTSMLRFRKKVNEYQAEGYACLISGKFGNQSSRKVSYKTERLILGIAVLPNKPFNTSVWEMYNSFVCGELEVWDYETGELLNPDEWTDKNGEPMSLSESTITNYLNMPKNRVLIDQKQMSYTTFMHEQMPHVHRHAPEFSFSKVSFDDRDLPRKLADTKIRPKAYYAYDVASQCVVGFAYNRYKNVDLVTDCFRSMFRLIERHGWGCPAQVEVENHLMSQWRDSFLKAGVLFPFVRFCAPMNSQEKYAEPLNGAKKRSIEHKNHLGIGRFYAKGRAYRTESKKVFDAANDTYEDKQYYTWEELIADDMRDIQEFNHSLHPNQKKYPGMTRWQVLEANMNPTLQTMDKSVWARFIGERVSTTIRRNSYCKVAYKDWWLSKTEVIEKLEPNNWKVDAFYLTNDEGEVTDVYIFQNDRLIDKLEDVGTFNTADAEQTDEDREIFVAQQKKIADFNSYVSRNAIKSVKILLEDMTVKKGYAVRSSVDYTTRADAEVAVSTDSVVTVNVQGYKQVRYPSLSSALYGAIFVDADGKVVKRMKATSDSGILDGMYCFTDIPDDAVSLVFTIVTAAPFDYVLLTKSDKIEAIEPDWVEHEECLVGVYEAYLRDDFLFSISGVGSTASVSQADFRVYARNRGIGFQLVDWEMHKDIGNLFFAKYGGRDSQGICGPGAHTIGRATGASNATGMQDTTANADGSWYKQTLSSDGSYYPSGNAYVLKNDGDETRTAINSPVVLGYENWHGNKAEWMDNVGFCTNAVDYKWDIGLPDGTKREVQGAKYSGAHFYPKCVIHGRYMDTMVALSGGSTSTHYHDSTYQNATKSRVVYRSYYSAYSSGGVSYANANYDSSNTSTSIGSRLAFRGKIVVARSVAAFKAISEID